MASDDRSPGLFDADDVVSRDAPEDTAHLPLAERMRPRTLDEIVGQAEIVGPGTVLRRAIETDRLVSLILFGPPGTGKTTLARVIASATKRRFVPVNAVASGAAEIKGILADAKLVRDRKGTGTVLFVDELHRFNKAQQEILLPGVEAGIVRLIGATAVNPLFYIVPALLSRSLLYEFRRIETEPLVDLARRALADAERGVAGTGVSLSDAALERLAERAEGDARVLLNHLELIVLTHKRDDKQAVVLDGGDVERAWNTRFRAYDRDGDMHYDVASAFIKSMRGSDPDAALYWLAIMLESGEDPRFIARRITILAAEDVGLADPKAITVATSAFQAVEFVGMPEANLILSMAVLYMALAPKSNSATLAIGRAQAHVRDRRAQGVPEPLRNKRPGRRDGESGYLYPHDFPEGYVEQDYMPERANFYDPVRRGYEARLIERLERIRASRKQAP